MTAQQCRDPEVPHRADATEVARQCAGSVLGDDRGGPVPAAVEDDEDLDSDAPPAAAQLAHGVLDAAQAPRQQLLLVAGGDDDRHVRDHDCPRGSSDRPPWTVRRKSSSSSRTRSGRSSIAIACSVASRPSSGISRVG